MTLILTVEQMLNMSQEQVIEAYRQGYQLEELAFPGIYPDENEIIPYSPRRKFGFASPILTEETDILTAQNGISISTGALLLIIGTIGLLWYMKREGKL